MVDVKVPGAATAAELDGYLATPPAGSGPWPGVVVLHDAFGLTADTRRHVDRLAAAGYVALAPNLFSARGPRCVTATIRAAMSGRGPAYDDLEAVRRYLAGRDDCAGRVGVVGFCMGGGFALVAATRGFDAAAPNYGMMPKGDLAAVFAGACPIVASFGARDVSLRGAAARLDAALTEAGVPHDVKEYPKVGHSFMNKHPVYSAVGKVLGVGHDEAATNDAYARILDFFDRHLR
ncbi:dienelactone hydrolase family protein [Frankia sp. CN6]|uniref:Dienelactone hydrolase family protein n=1 Tax=Frankia nepalensis TaxID=1836974 RepID=A0A937RRH8_9ACTN|nr:dienelactone hydrolase family protein [Frankia nepalensis]